jgi:hypothetical protein
MASYLCYVVYGPVYANKSGLEWARKPFRTCCVNIDLDTTRAQQNASQLHVVLEALDEYVPDQT